MSTTPYVPYPGMQAWRDRHGKVIVRLHYEADPQKAEGEKLWIPELSMWLSPWAKRAFETMTNQALYRQEFEIDGSATQGSLIYCMDPEATLEDAFPIPPHWTRYFSTDPHPAVPHAHLWCAVDPWGDRWYYRELWPSKVCFRWEGGTVVGERGPCPEDDFRFTIKDYVQTIAYLESDQNPENRDEHGRAFDERISKRVIDYSARAFGKGTNDDTPQPNFQQRYQLHMTGECDCKPRCRALTSPWYEDSRKDHEVGEEMVNQGLKPRLVAGADGKDVKRSRIHIFRDRCPELKFQLMNARRQQLSPLQVVNMDPTGKPVQVRLHMVDNCRYIEMANPLYVPPRRPRMDHKPPVEGIGY